MGVTNQRVTPYRNIDVDESGDLVIAGPYAIATFYAYNAHATDKRYLKIYDKATAPAETDTPVWTVPLTAGGGVAIHMISRELPFLLGIGLRATTGIADNDTGAPGNNEVVVNLGLIENFKYTL